MRPPNYLHFLYFTVDVDMVLLTEKKYFITCLIKDVFIFPVSGPEEKRATEDEMVGWHH